ncbi:MAG: hypothetical protein IPG96_17775 [Proteobacteria bacterium]|nr:hypothetical protein [Pseudomonadota bacterium]
MGLQTVQRVAHHSRIGSEVLIRSAGGPGLLVQAAQVVDLDLDIEGSVFQWLLTHQFLRALKGGDAVLWAVEAHHRLPSRAPRKYEELACGPGM